MSDPIDDALKALAHAEASRDFAARVRARIDAGEQVRVAGGHGSPPRARQWCWSAALVVVGSRAAEVIRASGHTGGAGSRCPSARPSVPELEPRTRQQDVSASAPVVGVAQPVARVRATRATAGDHERALPPLPPLDALSMSSIAPDAMVLGDQVVTPLAPIAPISVVPDEAGDDERGKL